MRIKWKSSHHEALEISAGVARRRENTYVVIKKKDGSWLNSRRNCSVVMGTKSQDL